MAAEHVKDKHGLARTEYESKNSGWVRDPTKMHPIVAAAVEALCEIDVGQVLSYETMAERAHCTVPELRPWTQTIRYKASEKGVATRVTYNIGLLRLPNVDEDMMDKVKKPCRREGCSRLDVHEDGTCRQGLWGKRKRRGPLPL